MDSKLKWLMVPLAAVTLAACEPAPNEDETAEAGTVTDKPTEPEQTEKASLSLGAGSGSDYKEGELIAAIGSNELSAGGTTLITANIIDVNQGNALYTDGQVSLSFTSDCVENGKASLSKGEVKSSTGIASVAYIAEGCVGDDTIIASYVDEDNALTKTANVTIKVAPAEANSVNFTATGFESTIAYANSPSALKKQSFVEFQVLDASGFPIEGQVVDFSLSSENPSAVSLSKVTAVTDENGLASTIVNASDSAMNILVTATIVTTASRTIVTQSLPIAATTGIADTRSFSMKAVEACVANAYNVGGVEAEFTAYAFDRNNHAIPDGTVVYFQVEDGAGGFPIGTCKTDKGACSVTWISDVAGRNLDALATVTAYTVGEDSFSEVGRSNGLYDEGDTLIQMDEVYFDNNYNGEYDPLIDRYLDYNNDGEFYDASNVQNPLFRGSICGDAAKEAGHCHQSSVHVWDNTQIALNTRLVSITPALDTEVEANAKQIEQDGFFKVFVSDTNGNYPPAGTKISVSSETADVAIHGSDMVAKRGECGPGMASFTVTIKDDDVKGFGTVAVEVTTPGDGLTTYRDLIFPKPPEDPAPTPVP